MPADFLKASARPTAVTIFPSVLKMCVYYAEPVVWKGGMWVPLHKSEQASICDNHRAIMLENNTAKVVKSAFRSRLGPAASDHMLCSQYGSLPGRGTEPAALVHRLMISRAKTRKLNLCAIFVDCSSAYYSVLRGRLAHMQTSDAQV